MGLLLNLDKFKASCPGQRLLSKVKTSPLRWSKKSLKLSWSWSKTAVTSNHNSVNCTFMVLRKLMLETTKEQWFSLFQFHKKDHGTKSNNLLSESSRRNSLVNTF